MTRSNGEVLRTCTESFPFSNNGRGAYVVIHGIPGNTHLRRVTMGWRKP